MNLTRDFPWWMRTRCGRWLCGNWKPAAVYWQTLTHLEIARRARAEAEQRGAELQIAAERCVERNFDDESRRALVGSWCGWRNAVDAEIAEEERFARK